MKYQRSFLKWAGSKYQLLNTILDKLPNGKRLLEPFAGSGVVFFNADYPRYLLNDINTDLISIYQQLKKYGQTFIDDSKQFFKPAYNCKSQYMKLREQFNTSIDCYERALLFIYLNRHCYNGLCRYNSSGIFNVPFGTYSKVQLNEELMQHFAKKLKKTTLHSQPYEKIFELAKPGDVIYCDPPYVSNHDSVAFKYFGQAFTFDDQQQLVELAKTKAEQGITTLISNHATDATEILYAGAKVVHPLSVYRSMNQDPTLRKTVSELLAEY